MSETKIKAVEMVREIRDAMYEETKDLSPAEYLQYIKRRAAEVEKMGTVPSSTDQRSVA